MEKLNTQIKLINKHQLRPGTDYIGISVFALIFNKDGQFLLVDHRPTEKKTAGFSNCWSMPGGTIEYSEGTIQALKREIREELGIEIFDEKLLNHNDYIVKGSKHWIGINFTAKTDEVPKIIEPEKIQKIQFFRPGIIPKNVSRYCRECLELLGYKTN